MTNKTAPELFVIDGYGFVDQVFVAKYTIVRGDREQSFEERIDFSPLATSPVANHPLEVGVRPTEPLLRLLALACSVSYYKATPATRSEIRFPITKAEQKFFADLIRGGLAEFAYVNQLPEKLAPKITSTELVTASDDAKAADWNALSRPLVPIGGGKDSVVTIEALKAAGFHPVLFSVNRFEPIDRCVAESKCDYVSVKRTLDPKLRELNAAGGLNGHIPVTAINSLIALVAADLLKLGVVIMSNESSASSGNIDWNGIPVNHQWSKSLEFEDLLRTTLKSDGLSEDRYFSLLRSLRELDIVRNFAKHPEYFSAFTSCNRVFRSDSSRRAESWCGECPKCHFIFLILAPFISKAEVVAIFGSNLLEDEANQNSFEEILGINGFKPFECVGEYDEAGEALALLAASPEWKNVTLVAALGEASVAAVNQRKLILGGSVTTPAVDRVPGSFLKARDAAVTA